MGEKNFRKIDFYFQVFWPETFQFSGSLYWESTTLMSHWLKSMLFLKQYIFLAFMNIYRTIFIFRYNNTLFSFLEPYVLVSDKQDQASIPRILLGLSCPSFWLPDFLAIVQNIELPPNIQLTNQIKIQYWIHLSVGNKYAAIHNITR